MRCTHCRIESKNLRAYARPDAALRSEVAEMLYLCPACRVLNALHPRCVPVGEPSVLDEAGAPPPAPQVVVAAQPPAGEACLPAS